MVNDQGGINGRKITFITYDDGFQPPKTVEMVRKLVEDDQVFAIYQLLGTPTNTVVQKHLNQKKVPQLFVATGASKWGMPKEFPWTTGWQPDYATEAAIYAKHILANVAASVASTLKPAGLDNSTDIITAAYLKDPTDPQWANAPDFLEWKAWMEKYMPGANMSDASYVYAYAVSATMRHVLK